MKYCAIWLMAVCSLGFAGGKKAFPGQAGNDNIDVTGTVMLDPVEIRQEVGGDPGPGIVVVRVKAMPKTGDAMRIGPDDFSLLSRKNGDRSDALAPAQITSKSSLTIKRDTNGRDYALQTNQPGFTGVEGIKKTESTAEDSALLGALKSKMLPDGDTKDAVEGLLYFSIDASKLKSKDLTLLYKGAGGRLTLDFK